MAFPEIAPPNLRDRIRRMVWRITWLLLYRPSPVTMHGWRRFLLRLFGATVGAKAHPYPSASIWAPWNLDMREGSCLGEGSDCYNVAPIRLGRWSIVSQKAYLCTATHDIQRPGFALTGAPIIIGDRAWVAADAFVGPGVDIGEGAVVAARAVVVRDVQAASVVAGNPAKSIGQSMLAEFAR
tara:strand:+ start:1664 stop:2209 length:546 start_codon:yes stop_codon:yes gene_type:complete